MRRAGSVAALMLLTATGARLAAQAPPPQDPTFRGGVTVLTIDAGVVDGDWRVVAGLTADDFEVELDGRRQPVRTLTYLDFDDGGVVGSPPAPAAAGAAPSAVTAGVRREMRTWVVLVDDVSFAPLAGKALTTAAERFVAELPAGDLVGLATTSGRQRLAPTRDRAALATRLRVIVGAFTDPRLEAAPQATRDDRIIEPLQLSVSEALRISRGDQGALDEVIARETGDACDCRAAFRALAEGIARAYDSTTSRQAAGWTATAETLSHMGGSPTLVLLTAGMAEEVAASESLAFATAVSRSGIALHVLSEILSAADAADGSIPGSHGTGMDRRRKDSASFLDGARDVAARSGGFMHAVVGRAADDFARVRASSAGKYRLAIELPSGARPGTRLKARVRVRRRGVRVFAASEYLVPGPAPVLTTEAQLRAAVVQGAAYYGVPVSLRTLVRRAPAGDALEVGLHVAITGASLPPYDVAFAVVGDADRVAKSGRTRIEHPTGTDTRRFALPIAVPPGMYRVRLAVADAAGNVGSVEAPINVRLGRMGALLASELSTGVVEADGRVSLIDGEDVPVAATALDVGVELYRGGTTPDDSRTVRLMVTGAGGRVVAAQDVSLVPDRAAWNAGVRVPLRSLPPDRYELAVELLEHGQSVGRMARHVTWAPEVGHAATPAPLSAPSPPVAVPPPTDAGTPTPAGPALPARDAILEALRFDAASRKPSADVAALLRKADIAAQMVRVPGVSPAGGAPLATQSDAEFWTSMDLVAERGRGARALFAKGLVALSRADWAKAASALDATLDAAPDALIAMRYRGAASAGIGEDHDAVGAWTLTLSAPDVTPEWPVALADALVRDGDRAGALQALDDAIGRWPEDGRLRARRGELRLAAGRVDDGRVDLEKAAALAVADARTLFLLTALAYAEVAAGSAGSVDVFDRLSASYLTLANDPSSPVHGWRRLVLGK